MDRDRALEWVAAYERAWRTAGTDGLGGIFTADASYRQGPYEDPVVGLPAIAVMWEAERDGPAEVFTMTSELVAVDGPTAVVRAEVRYGEPVRQEYRDLWVLRFAPDGRCEFFEEWPFWPERRLTGERLRLGSLAGWARLRLGSPPTGLAAGWAAYGWARCRPSWR